MKTVLAALVLVSASVSSAADLTYQCHGALGSKAVTASFDLRANLAGLQDLGGWTFLNFLRTETSGLIPPKTLLVFQGQRADGNVIRLSFETGANVAHAVIFNRNGQLLEQGKLPCQPVSRQ